MSVELPDDHRAVALVAAGLHRAFPPRWFRRTSAMDFIPAAREAVAILLLLPEGRELSARILSTESSVDGLTP